MTDARSQVGQTLRRIREARGLSLSDIALGAAMLEKATKLGLGQRLRYA